MLRLKLIALAMIATLALAACGADTSTAVNEPPAVELNPSPDTALDALPTEEPTIAEAVPPEPEPTIAEAPTVEAEPTVAPPQVAADGDLVIEGLETYTFPTNLFTIDVPQGWEIDENTSDNAVFVAWTAPSQDGVIFVSIYADPQTLTEDDLATLGNDFAESIFGDEPEFTLDEPALQDDDSVLVGWVATPTINGTPRTLSGSTYVEQRGDKVSLLTIIVPDEQYFDLWDLWLDEIANSYSIDPTMSLAE